MVHAPHSAMPQPNFVPVRPIWSRSTHKSGVSCGRSTSYCLPLILSLVMLAPPYAVTALRLDDGDRLGRWIDSTATTSGRLRKQGCSSRSGSVKMRGLEPMPSISEWVGSDPHGSSWQHSLCENPHQGKGHARHHLHRRPAAAPSQASAQ